MHIQLRFTAETLCIAIQVMITDIIILMIPATIVIGQSLIPAHIDALLHGPQTCAR